MYEHFRNELTSRLTGVIDDATMERVMSAVDSISAMYEITNKCGTVSASNGDLPQLVRIYLMARGT